MSIKFFIPGWDQNLIPKRASYRFRATIPLKGMRNIDGIITDIRETDKGDIVVLAKKSTPENVMNYLTAETITVINNTDGDYTANTKTTNT